MSHKISFLKVYSSGVFQCIPVAKNPDKRITIFRALFQNRDQLNAPLIAQEWRKTNPSTHSLKEEGPAKAEPIIQRLVPN